MQLLERTVTADGPGFAAEPSSRRQSLFAPRHNCWRVEKARRAAVLVDGAEYFRHLEDALRKAHRSIQIIGWDFDARIRLRQDVGEDRSPPLGQLLRQLVEANSELRVDILIWSLSLLHGPGALWPMLFGADWQRHPRIRVKLDTFHPLYAAHHQKIVCIDGKLAFVGGIDLTVHRWDTPQHRSDDPRRVDPDGTLYPPVHDLQMAVDGDAARTLCGVVRSRFEHAGIQPPQKPGGDCPDIWPDGLTPQMTDVPVAIARTKPGYRSCAQACEAQRLNLDAIAAARKSIYIEAQYMTALSIGDALASRLRERNGPEVLVVMTHESRGLIERLLMGNNRDRLIRCLRRADLHGRLRIYYPVVPATDGERQVLIHSKLIIVDDRFMRVGSSNLNNRSIGLDTECDLAIEADDPERRSSIAAIRDRLLAEHLDCSPQRLAQKLGECGSLLAAVDELNTRSRGLRAFEALRDDGPSHPVFGTALLDPVKPLRLPFQSSD